MSGNVEIRILELLEDSGLSLTPANIAYNLGYSTGYIRKQCNQLSDSGYLSKDAEGTKPYYEITDRGREYLREKKDGR